MPIYRMTKEEVQKRKLMVDDDSKKLKSYLAIAGSKAKVKNALKSELNEIKVKLADWIKSKDSEKKKLLKNIHKKKKKRSRRG